jgi:hypothetical protein
LQYWANSSQDPISKITNAKWTGGIARVVEHLLCKLETLSSNPNPSQKKKKRNYCSGNLLSKIGLQTTRLGSISELVRNVESQVPWSHLQTFLISICISVKPPSNLFAHWNLEGSALNQEFQWWY